MEELNLLVQHTHQGRAEHTFNTCIPYTNKSTANVVASSIWNVMKRSAKQQGVPMNHKTCKMIISKNSSGNVRVQFLFNHKLFKISFINSFNRVINKAVHSVVYNQTRTKHQKNKMSAAKYFKFMRRTGRTAFNEFIDSFNNIWTGSYLKLSDNGLTMPKSTSYVEVVLC